MKRNFGTTGHFSDPGMAIAAGLAMTLAMKGASRTRRSTVRTPEQIATADKRTERQRWNDEVDARKAAKKSGDAPAKEA